MKPLPHTALLDALAPGGRVVRVRRLRGGVSCSVHAVKLAAVDGGRNDVVVRRYREDSDHDPGVCSREFRLLTFLTDVGYACPQPLLLDERGVVFGAPTLVMSRLPGRGTLAPRDLGDYLEQLARNLAKLHSLPIDTLDFLPDDRAHVDERIQRQLPIEDWLLRDVCSAVRDGWPAVARTEPLTLVHGDFWPGNTVWHRGRLSGVVDWEMAGLGYAARDVATCRCDLTNLFGSSAAERFTSSYEGVVGRPLGNLPFWDLHVATGALRYMRYWVVGYQDLGRTDLSVDEAASRTAAFARRALDQLRA